MMADSGYTTLVLYHGFFPKGIMNRANTASITATCPSSTPILKDRIDVKNLLPGKPISFRALANPIPCISPNKKITPILVAFNLVEKMFSNATYKIDSAIKGSTTSVDGLIIFYIDKPSVTVCATVKAVACHKITFIF